MRAVLIRSGFVTLLSMCASVVVATIAMAAQGSTLSPNGLLMSLLCPLFIAWPASAWTAYQKRRISRAHEDLAKVHEELALVHAKLAEHAIRDPMTGLLNRAGFFDTLKSKTDDGSQGLLLIIDADHFKAINDTYGHPCGDRALVKIADAIARGATSEAVVGRIGGEEFAAFLPIPDPERAREIALGIRREVAAIEFHPSRDARLPLTVSIGGAALDPDTDVMSAMRLADRRLYVAKRAGRDRVVTRKEDGARAAA